MAPTCGFQKVGPTFFRCFLLTMFKPARVWLSDHKNLLLAVLIVIHLIPLWTFKYFPSQDGPAHLANANIIREYNRPDRTAFRTYYVINEKLTPNWVGHLVLAGLLSLMPMLVAEKVFLSAYVILLPISARYIISAVRPDSDFLAVLTFPFVYNYLLHMGFYSFSYNLPMFFFVFGYWLKYREDFTLRRIAALSVLSLLLYFAHIISMIAAYLAITLMTIWLMALKIFEKADRRQFPFRSRGNSVRMLRPFYAFLPTVTLCAIFILQKNV